MRWFERRLREFLNVTDLDLSSRDTSISDIETDIAGFEIELYKSSNTTATTYAPSDTSAAIISGMQTAITIEDGDIYIFIACIPISGGSTSDVWYLVQNVSGTTISPDVCIFQAPTANTTGKQTTLTMVTMFDSDDVGTGSKSFETKWLRESGTGGTVYSRRRHQHVYRIKGFQ